MQRSPCSVRTLPEGVKRGHLDDERGWLCIRRRIEPLRAKHGAWELRSKLLSRLCLTRIHGGTKGYVGAAPASRRV